MIELLALLLAVPIVGSLLLSCVSSQRADANARALRQVVPWLLAMQALVATALLLANAVGGEAAKLVYRIEMPSQLGAAIGIYVDGISSLMLLMVSIVGFVVSRYSIRYLDGEAMQGRYFRWVGFTVGAVSFLVVSGNLLQLFAAWVMTSFGLHQLLLHYRHREAAHRAAWTKFTISRMGDAFLIAAIVLTFQNFGTFDLESLFAQAALLGADSLASVNQVAIGWLIVLGAITKSAQFPFHTWLPDTMETPTPVSALMHAGIVNAGGYLVIRMSPILALSPNALMILAVIGGFTACFGGIVMMTQPSIKRALAYSTIAQMGFMMLQCGLGAFSAAMLHILAHSFYKAFAFLNSGSVIAQHSTETSAPASAERTQPSFAKLVAAMAVSVAAFVVISLSLGFSIAEKSGGLVLAFILCLALTTWGWQLFLDGQRKSYLFAIAGTSVLCFSYLLSYMGVNHLVSPSLADLGQSPWMSVVSFDIGLAFLSTFLLCVVLLQRTQAKWLEPLRVHATNGFYIDAIYRRVFGTLADS